MGGKHIPSFWKPIRMRYWVLDVSSYYYNIFMKWSSWRLVVTKPTKTTAHLHMYSDPKFKNIRFHLSGPRWLLVKPLVLGMCGLHLTPWSLANLCGATIPKNNILKRPLRSGSHGSQVPSPKSLGVKSMQS